MIRTLDQAASRLQRRVFWGVWIGRSARYLMWGAFAAGTIALLLRYAFDVERSIAAWMFAPLALAPLAAWFVARRRGISHEGAVLWLDVRSDAGGALVTRLERGDEAWRERADDALARAVVLPRVRVARPMLHVFPAFGFALAALWVELPRAPILPPKRIEEAALARIEEQLETLKEEVTLEPDLARELDTRIERLAEENADPEATYESIDRLDERLGQEGERLSETLNDAQESLAAAAARAGLDPEGAQKDLERTLADLSKAGLAKNLPEKLQKELGASSLTLPPGTKLAAGELQGLSQELRDALAKKLEKLGQAGLAKLGQPGKAGDLAKLDDFEPTGHVCDENCKKNPGGT